MTKCSTCKYFKDFTAFNIGLRCLNEGNRHRPGDFMIVPSSNYTCTRYKLNNPKDRFEWDPNKNESNKQKHGIGFEKVIDIYNDPHQIQMAEVPKKWEKINESEFETKGIEQNEGNLDPVRGKIIGTTDGKVYTFVYTFRHNFGDMTYRIISLRRASEDERQVYDSFKNREV